AVRMQVFDSDHHKVGKEILVNSTTLFEQENPVLTVLPDFRFVVAWQDNSHAGLDDDGYSIRSQIFDARSAGIDIDGTAKADSFNGSNFGDTIDAAGGSDKVLGGGGNDFIFGGPGGDFLRGEDDNDSADGGTGNDRLEGGKGNDSLSGGAGNDT